MALLRYSVVLSKEVRAAVDEQYASWFAEFPEDSGAVRRIPFLNIGASCTGSTVDSESVRTAILDAENGKRYRSVETIELLLNHRIRPVVDVHQPLDGVHVATVQYDFAPDGTINRP